MGTSIIVSIITMAMLTMLVTRPGAADVISKLTGFMASAINNMIGTVE